MHPCKPSSPPAQRGFTLVEALVALVVTAFGMLALAGFQASLYGASENAKQRSEAVRLAQQKIDEMRAFETIAADAALFDYATDVVAGGPEQLGKTSADAYNTANAYTRQWWFTRADGVTASQAGDAQKWLRVRVLWTDRKSQQQEVTLRSVLVRSEPADLGTLAVGPGAQNLRTPKNRHADIPYPAKKLSGGKSAFRPPGANRDYVFDHRTGDVLGYCTQSLNEGESVTLDANSATSGCTFAKSYLLSGYIRFLDNMPSGSEENVDRAISNPTDTTFNLTASVVYSTPMPTGHTPADCYAERQKVVSTNNAATSNIVSISRDSGGMVTVTTSSNHGLQSDQTVTINNTAEQSFVGLHLVVSTPSNSSFTYMDVGAVASSSGGTASLVQQLTIAESAPTPNGYNRELSRFVTYTCLVPPFDHDGDEATTPSGQQPSRRRWWGQMAITPVGSWNIGTGSANRKVCRFSGDYVVDDKLSNSEHPWYYRGVTGALDAQDYLVIRGNDTCPNDSKVAPLNDDYINTHTLLHQTAAGSAAAGAPSTTNSQWATTGEPNAAPSGVTDTLPMF